MSVPKYVLQPCVTLVGTVHLEIHPFFQRFLLGRGAEYYFWTYVTLPSGSHTKWTEV